MTLYSTYLGDNHRPMHKWAHYFPIYERHFERFRNRNITLFEIGVGQGGSLQIWKGFFGPYARIVGLDVYPPTLQCEEDQVSIRIGQQQDAGFLATVLAEFGSPDIVIDDGSHLQPDINATFDALYPHVAENGVYLIEDLHAAYWPNHGGGLGEAGSFIERAKDIVDAMHASYTGGELATSVLGERTRSLHFYDSVVVFEVATRRSPVAKLTGNPALFRDDWVPAGRTRESFGAETTRATQSLRLPDKGLERPPANRHRIAELQAALAERNREIERLHSDLARCAEDVRILQDEAAALRKSASRNTVTPSDG